jgi:hypothetical protein
LAGRLSDARREAQRRAAERERVLPGTPSVVKTVEVGAEFVTVEWQPPSKGSTGDIRRYEVGGLDVTSAKQMGYRSADAKEEAQKVKHLIAQASLNTHLEETYDDEGDEENGEEEKKEEEDGEGEAFRPKRGGGVASVFGAVSKMDQNDDDDEDSDDGEAKERREKLKALDRKREAENRPPVWRRMADLEREFGRTTQVFTLNDLHPGRRYVLR